MATHAGDDSDTSTVYFLLTINNKKKIIKVKIPTNGRIYIIQNIVFVF